MIAIHHPPMKRGEGRHEYQHQMMPEDRKRLRRWALTHNVNCIVHGHLHESFVGEFSQEEDEEDEVKEGRQKKENLVTVVEAGSGTMRVNARYNILEINDDTMTLDKIVMKKWNPDTRRFEPTSSHHHHQQHQQQQQQQQQRHH